MVSTSSSAGWPAASSAARTAPIRLVTPVEVSLCTTATALIARSRSSASRASMRAGSAPVRQSPSRSSTSRPSRRAISVHRVEKCPVSLISTMSPGESVFTSAASHAPVPDDGKITTSPRVRNISRRPVSTRWPSRPNPGPRWSMVGRSMARRIRSGTLVGPGIWRKWRPAGAFMTRILLPDRRVARMARCEVYAGVCVTVLLGYAVGSPSSLRVPRHGRRPEDSPLSCARTSRAWMYVPAGALDEQALSSQCVRPSGCMDRISERGRRRGRGNESESHGWPVRTAGRLERSEIFTVEPRFRKWFPAWRYEAAMGMTCPGGLRREGRRACLVGP